MEQRKNYGRPIVVGKTATLRGVLYHRSMSAVLNDGDIIESCINCPAEELSQWYAKYNNYDGKEWLEGCDADGNIIECDGAGIWFSPSDFASDHMAYCKPDRVRNINGWDHCKKMVYPHLYSLNVRVTGDVPNAPKMPKRTIPKKAKDCDAEWEAKEKARKQDMEREARERERAEKDQARYNPKMMPLKHALAVLGMTEQNTKGEVRKAYILLAKENHPDKTNGDPVLAGKFREAQEAWESLCAIYGWN